MPNIDSTSPANNQTHAQYTQDDLKNARILLYNTELALDALITGNHQSYELDTGQGKQRVTRLSIPELTSQMEYLESKIARLELYLGERQGSTQIIPGF